MSIKDIFKFEGFNGKHILKDLGKHPWRAVTGIDPLSTGAWNKVLGRHDQPLVDQMGGAYGGHVISAFGNKDGGVYADAQKAGIDTKSGGQMQDAAHVIAALIAGNYLQGKLPTQEGNNGFNFQQGSIGGQQQQPEQQPIVPDQMVSIPQTQPMTAPKAAPVVNSKKEFRMVGTPTGLMRIGQWNRYG